MMGEKDTLDTIGKNQEELTEKEAEELAEIEKSLQKESLNNRLPNSILVRGATLVCTNGTHARKLNLPKDYGMYITGTEMPKVHENNCKVGDDKNISYYGICKSKNPPEGESIYLEPYTDEEGNKTSDEKGKWPDGTSKREDPVCGVQCQPCILGKWLNPVEDEKIYDQDEHKYYQAISQASILVCKYGGFICAKKSGQGNETKERLTQG